MRHLLFSLGLTALLASCGDYQKALKGTDINAKLAAAEKYYAIGEKGELAGATNRERRRSASGYQRAIPLLEELIQLTRGTNASERVYYLHAKSQFGMKDYLLASYYLNNFVKTFPTSSYAEECAFLAAYCYYKNSPNYELDQTDTRAAMNDLQIFLVHYPESILKDSCNALMDRLRGKMELKELNNARQYFRLRNYQGAMVAFRNFAQDWPNSEYREEALFTILQASHQLAMNSVEEKKRDRLKEAIRSYHNFADAFPESIDKREADRLLEQLNAELTRTDQPANP